MGWLIGAAYPAPRKPALGFHTDTLLFRLLVALITWRDLLLRARHLFVAAMGGEQTMRLTAGEAVRENAPQSRMM